ILYTHLGKVRGRDEVLGKHTREALRCLASLQRQGRVLVTTTRRVLDYHRFTRNLHVSATQTQGELAVRVSRSEGTADVERELAGLTLYVPDTIRARLIVDGRNMTTLVHN